MRFWKSFSFFFIYPFTMMVIGFISGIVFMHYFYPYGIGRYTVPEGDAQELLSDYQRAGADASLTPSAGAVGAEPEGAAGGSASGGKGPAGQSPEDGQSAVRSGQSAANGQGSDLYGQSAASGQSAGEYGQEESREAGAFGEKLGADTAYVLEETDLQDNSVVETTWKLPAKYIGMNREEFLSAMESFEASPPLSELERGFVSLEVLSFSRDKVVVRMNYDYVQPGSSFFVAVEDDRVVVFLEDRKTVYMYTDILATELPDPVQQDLINWLYMPDEESLYDFLESYSS